MLVQTLISYINDRRFFYQFVATLGTYWAIRIVRFMQLRKRKFNLMREYGIPGPEPSIFKGNLEELTTGNGNIEVLKRWADKYGKFFGYFVGSEPSIVVSDVDMIRKIFIEEASNSFTERSDIFIDVPLTHGILFARNARWKMMRKVMSPSFSSYTMRGSSSTEFIEESVRLMIDYIDHKLAEARTANQKANIDVQNLLKSTALHLISAMAIKLPDIQVKEDDESVRNLDEYLGRADKGPIIYAIMFPFVKDLVQILVNHMERDQILERIDKQLNKLIDEGLAQLAKKAKSGVRQTDEPLPLIDTLIKLHYEGKLSRIEVRGNVEALLIAGYDTTSTTLTYVFWVLAKNPDIQERLRHELMAHGLGSGYLDQVINETMRLYPTVNIFTTRLATKTVKINDWTIPEGVRVVYSTCIMHQDPELWPNPEKFDPSRFEEGADIYQCAFAPFGLGDRRCLGYKLAMLEMKAITCDILLRYRLILKSPENLELVSYAVSLTKPKERVVIELEKL